MERPPNQTHTRSASEAQLDAGRAMLRAGGEICVERAPPRETPRATYPVAPPAVHLAPHPCGLHLGRAVLMRTRQLERDAPGRVTLRTLEGVLAWRLRRLDAELIFAVWRLRAPARRRRHQRERGQEGEGQGPPPMRSSVGHGINVGTRVQPGNPRCGVFPQGTSFASAVFGAVVERRDDHDPPRDRSRFPDGIAPPHRRSGTHRA